MVCTTTTTTTTTDFQGWKDFPKGLCVLLLDQETDSANEIRSKLEELEYIVYTYRDENEALSAISSKHETFHVAIVEVSASNCERSFKFLESAKDLPTVMTSNFDCLNTMMKCIALGAVEFLRKPLSDDKLRNIWQHVLHKAFNGGVSGLSVSLKPIKESVLSILQLKSGEDEKSMIETEDSDRYPAPSTPQLGGRGRLMGDGACQHHSNNSVEKSVDIMEDTFQVGQLELSETKDRESPSSYTDNNGENTSKIDGLDKSCRTRAIRKKTKVDWTSELHKKFVKAVDQLGVDQAIPSRILELMKVEGLTRHNVASHLQKYRMQRRQILPKDDMRWKNTKDSSGRSCNYYPQRPLMAFPQYYSYNYNPQRVVCSSYQGGAQMWTPPPYHPYWPPLNTWQWRTSLEINADAWGCPVMPPPPNAYSSYSQNFPTGFSMTHTSFDLQPEEEEIDKVVKEAISKPWLPLPLGLKPPSTESVLTELSRQGISTVPFHINGSGLR